MSPLLRSPGVITELSTDQTDCTQVLHHLKKVLTLIFLAYRTRFGIRQHASWSKKAGEAETVRRGLQPVQRCNSMCDIKLRNKKESEFQMHEGNDRLEEKSRNLRGGYILL